MERQKLWICIGIAFLLLIAVLAAVLLSSPEGQTGYGTHFVSLVDASDAAEQDGAPYAFQQDSGASAIII